MRLKYLVVLVLTVAALVGNYLVAPDFAYSHAAEPPAGYTNAPSESNCTNCHSGTLATNSSDITVSSSPAGLFTTGYVGGQVYAITYTLSNTATDYGFEVTSLNSSDDAAGTFAITNTTTTTLQTANGRQYMGHKNADATFSWTFNWTAPVSSTGTVTFYGVGLLGNGNGKDTGDKTVANTFVANPAPACNLTVSLSSSNVTCNGAENGTATAVPANGASPYSYSWSNGAGNTIEAASLAPGTISVTVTDSKTCTATASTVISQPNAITATVTSTGSTCNEDNGSISVTAAGGAGSYKYSWNTAPAQSTANASGIGAGNYTATVTDANSCTATASGTVSNTGLLPDSVTNISGRTTVCPGSNIYSITAQNGIKYTWALSDGGSVSPDTGAEVQVMWSAAGTHSLSITPSNTCGNGPKSVLQVVVNDPAPTAVPVIKGDTTPCPGQNTYLVNTQTGLNYSWAISGGGTIVASNDTNITIDWNNIGTYSINVTPSNTCGQGPAGTLHLNVISAPTVAPIITGNTSPCLNQFAYSIAPQAGLSYSWSLAAGGQILSASDSAAGIRWDSIGSYVLSVTPSNTCGSGPAGTLNISVNNNPPATPVISGSNSACTGTSPGYSINGEAGVVYNWILPAGGVLSADTGTSVSVTWNSSGDYLLKVVPSDVCGTGDTAGLSVTVGLGTATAGLVNGDTSACINTPKVYYIIGGNANSYSWSLSGGGSATATASGDSATISWTDTGNYSISVYPLTSCGYGNPSTLAVSIKGPPPSPVIIGNDSVCSGSEITLSVNPAEGISYTWSASDSAVISAQDSESYILWSSAGEATASVTASNQCGAGIPGTKAIAVITAPESPQVLGPDSICLGDGASFHVVPQTGATYIWNASDSGSIFFNYSSANISWPVAGSYNVSVTSANGCGNSSPTVQDVLVYSVSPVNLGTDTALCAGSFVISLPGYYNYSWSTGSTNDSIHVTESATYYVTATDDSGCITTGSRNILFYYTPPPNLPDSVASCDSVILDPGSLYSTYSWSNGDSAEFITVYQTGSYTITLTTSNDCQVSKTSQVRIDREPLAGFTFTIDSMTVSFIDTSTDPAIYQWDFGDGDTSAQADPVHQYSSPGFYEVILTVVNTCDSNSYLHSVVLGTTTGIDAVDKTQALRAYPNPVTDRLTISSQISGDVEVLDETGKEVFRSSITGGQPMQVNTANLAGGLYLVKWTANGETATTKVVKL